MNYQALVEQIRHHVISLFSARQRPDLVYHNLEHTQTVVDHAKKIAQHYQLSEPDHFVVMAAAWFHDTGYLEGRHYHEENGAKKAEEFLKQHQVSEETISAVKHAILATRMPQSPKNLLEQIVCDADLYHFGSAHFDERSNLMRKELEIISNCEIRKKDWRNNTVKLMEAHRYHTDYARDMLNAAKEKNLEALKLKQADKEAATLPEQEGDEQNQKKKKIKGEKRPERGIETMFRISATNHQRLSDMADNKAQIMLTVNSIILSVIISVLVRKIEENPHLTIPAFLLLSVNVITLIFAVLATRPSIPNGTFTQKELDEKNVNLLFFGNFYKMSLQEYSSGMLKIMGDSDFLYGNLIKDVYSQGVVLGKKYKLLRICYNVFMYGIITSVIAFLIASLSYSN